MLTQVLSSEGETWSLPIRRPWAANDAPPIVFATVVTAFTLGARLALDAPLGVSKSVGGSPVLVEELRRLLFVECAVPNGGRVQGVDNDRP
jgi:hypothetical protein